ncbi:MAG: enoyl-CoA hydratase-related protein, partial [Gammaproteobacteria bacterium]|nr:enoyl-CoA hydratase-related protein [Gammaproteobacteria bacterium]
MLDRYADYHALDLDSPADRILRISFNKPETYNSLDKDGHRELTYIWREIDEDPNVSAVILTGKVKRLRATQDENLELVPGP